MSRDSTHVSHSVVVVRDFSKAHLPSVIDSEHYLAVSIGDVVDVIYEPEDCVSPQGTWIYGRKRGTKNCGWVPSTYTVMLKRGNGPLQELSYEEQLWLENRCLTRFIENAINYLLKDHRYAVEGIFRSSGDKRTKNWIMAHVARAGSINFEYVPGITVQSVADSIKFYLKKLPESIIPPRLLTQFDGFISKYKDSMVLESTDFSDTHLRGCNQGFDYTACRRRAEVPNLSADSFSSRPMDMFSVNREKYAFFFDEDLSQSLEASSLVISEDVDDEFIKEQETLSLQLSNTSESTLSEDPEIVYNQIVHENVSVELSPDTNAVAESNNDELVLDLGAIHLEEAQKDAHLEDLQQEDVYQSYEYNPLGSYGVGPYYVPYTADDVTGTDEGYGSTDNSTEFLLEDHKENPILVVSTENARYEGSSVGLLAVGNQRSFESKGNAAAEFIFNVLPLSRFILLRSIMVLCSRIMKAHDVTKMTPQSFKQVFYMYILDVPNNDFSTIVSQKLTEFLFTNWPLFEEYYSANGIPFFDPATPLSRCTRIYKNQHTSMQNILVYVLATFDPIDYVGVSNSIRCVKIRQGEVVALVRMEGKWALIDTGSRQGWVDLACLQHGGLFCLVDSASYYELDSSL